MFGAGLAIRPDNPIQRADAQGFSLQLLPMDVKDAEGLDSERGLAGKDDKERLTTTSKNEMEVNTEKMMRTLFTLKQLEPCRVRMSVL